MFIYNYSKSTNEYCGYEKASLSPLERGVYLIPAFSTPIKPPEVGHGFVPCFIDGSWEVKEDHRGTIAYRKSDGKPMLITMIGSIPEELTVISPVNDCSFWEGDGWKVDLQKANEAKKQRIKSFLSSSPEDVACIMDNLISILFLKGIISMSDFSTEARNKLNERMLLRAELSRMNE